MNLTPAEIKLIRQAQDYCRRRKATRTKEEFFPCPFASIKVTEEICILCHKWTGLLDKYGIRPEKVKNYRAFSHPCSHLSIDEVRTRFWRNPKLEPTSGSG